MKPRFISLLLYERMSQGASTGSAGDERQFDYRCNERCDAQERGKEAEGVN